MAKERLQYVKTALTKYGFRCQLLPEDDKIPYSRLQVSLGPDDHQRERTLVLRIDKFPLPPDLRHAEQPMGQDVQTFLYLFVAFPFSFKEEATWELTRLLMYFNKPLEIPGFGIDEINKLVFYRYSLIASDGMVKTRPLVAIIGSIMLLMDALSPQIEAVAQGASMPSVVKSAIEAATGYKLAA